MAEQAGPEPDYRPPDGEPHPKPVKEPPGRPGRDVPEPPPIDDPKPPKPKKKALARQNSISESTRPM